MIPEQTKEYDRMKSLVIRRLQTAGAEGISANDFAPMLHAEFEERSPNACRSLLIRMANDGKIFRKAVGMERGGVQSHYFLTAEWCDAYRKNLLAKTLGPATSVVQTIPKFSVVEHRDVDSIQFAKGVTVKPGVKVQVIRPYDGDYRIKVDPSHRGEWSREWQEKRQSA